MAGRKFQHLPLRGASLTKFCAFCICLKIFFYLVWLCTIFVLLFALVNRTNLRRNKIVYSLMSVILNQVLVFFFLKNSRIPISQTTPPPLIFLRNPRRLEPKVVSHPQPTFVPSIFQTPNFLESIFVSLVGLKNRGH